jgi:hypothetical protein
MVLFRKLILVFLVLWLPVNPVLAIVMPFCQHSPGVATHDVHGVAIHEHATQPPGHGYVLDKAGGFICARFTLCHLAGAWVVASFSEVSSADLKAEYNSFSVPHFTQFIPEQPEHPPRIAFA